MRTSAGISERQRQMLSYLNPAQMKQWNAYSAIEQRRILEEIERKVERRVGPDPEGIKGYPAAGSFTPAMEIAPNDGPETYRVEFSRSVLYRSRGHPEYMTVRTLHQADLRRKSMQMRYRGAQDRKKQTEGTACWRMKNKNTGNSVSEARKGGKDILLKAELGREASGKRKAVGGRLQDRKANAGKPEIWKTAVMRQKSSKQNTFEKAPRGSPAGVLASGGKNTEGMSPDTHAANRKDIGVLVVRSEMIRKSGNHQNLVKDPDFGDSTKQMIRREMIRKRSPQIREFAVKNGLPEGKRPGSALREHPLIRLEQEEKLRMVPVPRVRVEPEEVRTEAGKSHGTAKTGDKAIKESGDRERTIPGDLIMHGASDKKEDAAEEQAKTFARRSPDEEKEPKKQASKAMALTTGKRAEQGRREVVKNNKTQKSEFYPDLAGTKEASDGENGKAKATQDRRSSRNRRHKTDKKKERRYRKAYVAELVRIIERDSRKQENIRQAQKTGQINESVSELTGQTGRSAFLTAAIPLRVALKSMTKRLRKELKKKMKEAVAALVKYAAAFGGPVFMIILIVMLLSGFLMSFISEQQSGTGTGLGYLIVQEAKSHLGLPYVYGGTDLETGCDCSGFVWAVYNKFGYNLPRTAGDQYSYGRKVGSDVSDWQLGDLIYYSRTGSVQSGGGRAEHIVIYIGGGQVISCGPVAIYNWDYRSDYYGTCRIIPDEATGGDFSGSTNEEICWNYFISQGFSPAATAGILGNMYVESGGTFDPSIHQYGGGPGRGLCQWEESYSGGSGRYNNLVAFANGLGLAWDDITAQLQFVSYELNSGAMNPYFSKWGGVPTFMQMEDPADATYVFLCGFEYCGDPGAGYMEANFSLSTRVNHAQWAYQNYG